VADGTHIAWLVAIIGVLWTLVLLLGGFSFRTALANLKIQIEEQYRTSVEAAKLIQTALETARAVEDSRWDRYETEHRLFREELLKHEQRLSRLEGEHATMYHKHSEAT
jgi:hypothetical protein